MSSEHPIEIQSNRCFQREKESSMHVEDHEQKRKLTLTEERFQHIDNFCFC